MVLGLAVDVPFPLLGGALARLCASHPPGVVATAWHHVAAMPAAFCFMMLGGVAAMLAVGQGGRWAFDIACNLSMAVGMVCAWDIAQYAPWQWDPWAALAAMAAGMVWGMAAMALAWRAVVDAFAFRSALMPGIDR